MKNKIIFGLAFTVLAITQLTFALAPKETAKYFNGPTVSNITTNSASVSLSSQVLADIAPEEQSGIYFEYYETQQVCIMIYPTPVECLPKKTPVGQLSAQLTNLKPNTSYTVKYKRDNTPPFESLSVEFVTKNDGTTTVPNEQIKINRNLFLGMRNNQVTLLQNFLIERGYLDSTATGFFGVKTMRAVQTFQRINNINATGSVGPLTRAGILKATTPSAGEYFEGTISAYSTACFADGICSVTVGGKVVVTTRGWARDPVGTLSGVESIGDIEKVIGHNAKVYAAKTADGSYTLYGNTNFYVKVQ